MRNPPEDDRKDGYVAMRDIRSNTQKKKRYDHIPDGFDRLIRIVPEIRSTGMQTRQSRGEAQGEWSQRWRRIPPGSPLLTNTKESFARARAEISDRTVI